MLALLPLACSACKHMGKTNFSARGRYKSKGRTVCKKCANKPRPLKERVTQDTSHMAPEQLHTQTENEVSSTNRRARLQRAPPDQKYQLTIPQNYIMYHLFQPFRRKARLYLMHLPPTDRTNSSNLHPRKQTSSPMSRKSQTKTKKSLLWQTF